ncbi:MAG: DUF2703 domain-containing protein [Candidatus Bathyarchaeia archaeon]
MNSLRIKWQRLVSGGETCSRCDLTGRELERAVNILRRALKPLGLEVTLEKVELSMDEFVKSPLESNKILINDRPLEDWLGGEAGQSPCCGVCGPHDCRTIKLDGRIYEAITADLIVEAGLAAASKLLSSRGGCSCSGSSGSCRR